MMMITSRHHRDGCLQAPPVLRGNSEDRRTSLHLTHCMVMMIMYDVDDLVCLVSCGEEALLFFRPPQPVWPILLHLAAHPIAVTDCR